MGKSILCEMGNSSFQKKEHHFFFKAQNLRPLLLIGVV